MAALLWVLALAPLDNSHGTMETSSANPWLVNPIISLYLGRKWLPYSGGE